MKFGSGREVGVDFEGLGEGVKDENSFYEILTESFKRLYI